MKITIDTADATPAQLVELGLYLAGCGSAKPSPPSKPSTFKAPTPDPLANLGSPAVAAGPPMSYRELLAQVQGLPQAAIDEALGVVGLPPGTLALLMANEQLIPAVSAKLKELMP